MIHNVIVWSFLTGMLHIHGHYSTIATCHCCGQVKLLWLSKRFSGTTFSGTCPCIPWRSSVPICICILCSPALYDPFAACCISSSVHSEVCQLKIQEIARCCQAPFWFVTECSHYWYYLYIFTAASATYEIWTTPPLTCYGISTWLYIIRTLYYT